jgi:hypothetical protein
MEAKFYNPLSTRLKTRKASGLIHSKSENLRTRSTNNGGQEKIWMDICCSLSHKENKFALPLLFVLYRTLTDWMATHIGEGKTSFLSDDSNANLF